MSMWEKKSFFIQCDKCADMDEVSDVKNKDSAAIVFAQRGWRISWDWSGRKTICKKCSP